MKIEVWSDFVCPFCYIGKRRLERALNKFPERSRVKVIYKSFELDPYSPSDDTVTIHEALAEKYGVSVEEARKMNENIVRLAKGVGLNYNMDKITPTNTLRAHRLAKFAETRGKEAEMTERLFSAHFIESLKIDDAEVLADLAEEIGLDRSEVRDVLRDENQFLTEVRKDERTAAELGVRGVPFFVLNGKYALSGAQPEEIFLQALQKVAEEEKARGGLKPLVSEGGPDCTADSCEIPQN